MSNNAIFERKMKHFQHVRVLGWAALLAGCGSVPLPSLIQLSRVNAQTTDLGMLRVAVRLPEAIKPRAGGVNMVVVAKVSGEPDQRTTLLLTETRDAADLSGLAVAARPGFSTYAYRLAPGDIERLALIRAALSRKREEGAGGSLGIGIATKEFCLVGPLPSGPLLSTTYLSTSETRNYVVLTNDLDLRNEPTIAAELSKLGPC
jgi:hypothetical protein